MTKRNKWASIALMTAVALSAGTACNNKKEVKPSMPRSQSEQLAIRYIDEDSLYAQYNLAKDFNEAALRQQNTFDQTAKRKEQEINNFGRNMEQKYKNNQYLSQDAFAADQNKLQQMQAAAQQELGKLQQSMATEAEQNVKQVNDSINNFLKDYAKEKGYDIILRKQATMFIDERFDVTSEVVEGLNKRYNKVEKKK